MIWMKARKKDVMHKITYLSNIVKNSLLAQYNNKIKSFFRGANEVSIGDDIMVDINGELAPDQVTGLSSSTMKGGYCSIGLLLSSLLYFQPILQILMIVL